MNEDEFYTYQPAFKTEIFQNEGGGITVSQEVDYMPENPMIVLTIDQAKWLTSRLARLIESIERDDMAIDGKEDA